MIQTKGNKDRHLPLHGGLLQLLQDYLADYRPTHWLFEGQTRGQYSATSIQSVFVSAKERSALPDQLTVDGLRHGYATHLVERGTPLQVVKDLLGHENIQTTKIYLHTSSERFRDLHDPLADLWVCGIGKDQPRYRFCSEKPQRR
ncbi:MAG: tyrosine-type recombinase/integrase, partial [Saprospiraceae bacterium]